MPPKFQDGQVIDKEDVRELTRATGVDCTCLEGLVVGTSVLTMEQRSVLTAVINVLAQKGKSFNMGEMIDSFATPANKGWVRQVT